MRRVTLLNYIRNLPLACRFGLSAGRLRFPLIPPYRSDGRVCPVCHFPQYARCQNVKCKAAAGHKRLHRATVAAYQIVRFEENVAIPTDELMDFLKRQTAPGGAGNALYQLIGLSIGWQPSRDAGSNFLYWRPS